LTFKRSGSGCCLRSTRTVRAPLADGSRGGFQPAVRRVLRVFLRAFRSILFVVGFLLHEVRRRFVLECRKVRVGADGPRAHCERSVIEGAVLEVRGCFRTVRRSLADIPPRPHGRSAWCLRTVCPGLADGPPGACGQSAWSSAEVLSLSLFEFRFRFRIVWVAPRVGRFAVTMLPWQTCVGILGCDGA
jgi:hypothetical protein